MPLKNDEQPAGEGPKTTGTLNGITITYPQAWHLIDPDTAGLNGSAMMSESPLPRIVLALAPTEAPGDVRVSRQVGGDAAPFLMTIQEEPLAIPGSAVDALAGRARTLGRRRIRVELLSGLGVPAGRVDRLESDVRGSDRVRSDGEPR